MKQVSTSRDLKNLLLNYWTFPNFVGIDDMTPKNNVLKSTKQLLLHDQIQTMSMLNKTK